MELADTIVLLNHGKIAQTGGPRDLYDRPANSFVMGFLGPVSQLSEGLVRPHDLEVLPEPHEEATEAQVDRVLHLGFEVRVELTPAEGEPVVVQLARHEAERLELAAGDVVWVRALTAPVPPDATLADVSDEEVPGVPEVKGPAVTD